MGDTARFQKCHEEVYHQADDTVGDERTARACDTDGLAACDEETRTDRAADRDHVHVTGFQASSKLLFFICQRTHNLT